MQKRLHVYVSGRVQGVGYRQATYAEALSLGIVGWVRNLPDGRVEAVFEGEESKLDAILSWCSTGPSFSKVSTIETTWENPVGDNSSFEIRF